jgi:hypothetical protein
LQSVGEPVELGVRHAAQHESLAGSRANDWAAR